MNLPWIAVFLTLFASGTLLAAISVPPETIGSRFHRFCATTAMFLAVLAPFSAGVLETGVRGTKILSVIYAGALVAYAVAVRFPGFRWFRTAHGVLGAAGIIVALAGLEKTEPLFAYLISVPASAAVLGAALVAMMLGHSYLSAGNLSFDLLIRGCRVLLVALAVRGVSALAFFAPNTAVLTEWIDRDMVLALLVIVRFLVGIVSAIGLGVMAHACAKIKSNQSATGILYITVGFVMIGELVACYVMGDKGLAL